MAHEGVIGDIVYNRGGIGGGITSSLVLPECFIGVEAELEHAYGPEEYTGGLWTRVSEGSMHQDGIEYVFSCPLRGTLITDALEELEKLYKSCPPTTGNDTSLHVHVDVRDLTMKQVWKFIMLYTMFEIPLFKYSSSDRMDNIFCLSSKSARVKVARYNDLLHFVKKGDTERFIDRANTAGRYSSMNLQSIPRFGSLEFRGHKGEWQEQPILTWINILMCLKRAVLDDTIPWEKPYLALKEMGLEAFTSYVFNSEYACLLRNKTFKKDVRTGCQVARSMVNFNKADKNRTVLKGCRNDKRYSLKSKHKKEQPNERPVMTQLSPTALDLPIPPPSATPSNWRHTNFIIDDGATGEERAALNDAFQLVFDSRRGL